MPKNNTIIVFVGLAGSGVSAAVSYCAQKGYPKVHLGDIVDKLLYSNGRNPNPEYRQQFRDENRTYLIARAIEQITNLQNAGQRTIVVDDLFSWTELKILRKTFPGTVYIVALTASSKTRYHRLSMRTQDASTRMESAERDQHEIEILEKGGPIAVAHEFINNEGTEAELYTQLDALLVRIGQ